MISKVSSDVYNAIKEVFPLSAVVKEHYVRYNRERLFFDFFIKNLGILVEVQGEQHFKFNKHFHGSVESFKAAKRRDNLKLEYAEEEGLTLVYFYDKTDDITPQLILDRIHEGQHE